MNHEFLGKPDSRFPNLKTGAVYSLSIKEESQGLFGWLVGNTRPIITHPIRCPYSSWGTFYENWKAL